MEIKNEIVDHIESLGLREKGGHGLKNLINNLSKRDPLIDGYQTEKLRSEFNRQEIRLLKDNALKRVVARFDLFLNDQEGDLPIGYYEYITSFEGEFIDEFLVFK